MKYFDEKIVNHEETFLKFKNLYENMQRQHLNCNSPFIENNYSSHTSKNSNEFSKGEKKMGKLKENVITARSMLKAVKLYFINTRIQICYTFA